MKKVITIILLNIIFLNVNVKACGEITELNTDIGNVTKINDMNYMVTIPEGTSIVTLSAKTDYDWVQNYGPRQVSTNNKVELKVDGNKCGYGIYTYFITFKHVSKLVAENTEKTPNENDINIQEDDKITENIQPDNESEDQQLKLHQLKIKGYEINFDPNIREYEIDVESHVTSLEIETTPEVDSYSINISDNINNLNEGENKVTIAIINSEGEIGTYTITVNRLKQLSDNNFLASIIIQGYTINFDPSQTNYNLTINNETMLNLNVVTEASSATYEINGNSNLKDKSKITIKVTAENGTTKEYVINIIKNFNILDYWIYIVIVLLTILLIVLLIINNRRKKKKATLKPETIEEPKETAGIIPETISQSISEPNQDIINQTLPTSNNGNIQIIEPTNIDDSETLIEKNQPEIKIEEPTEVFKL